MAGLERIATIAEEEEARLRRQMTAVDNDLAPLEQRLDTVVDDVSRRHPGLRVELAYGQEPIEVNAQVQGALIGATQEALLNVVRHASAEHAWVRVDVRARELVVVIRDDGDGANPGAVRGRGTDRSVRGRLAGVGGVAELETAPGRGTRWELRVPHGALAGGNTSSSTPADAPNWVSRRSRR